MLNYLIAQRRGWSLMIVTFGVIAVASLAGRSAICADDAISFSDFSQLEESQQLAWLKEAVLRFRRLTDNISANAKMPVRNMEFDPESQKMKPVVLMTGRLHDYRIRRIGASYRVRMTQEPAKRKPNVAYVASIEGYDSESGRGTQHDDAESDAGFHMSHGTIRPERGKVARKCFFYQYLGDDSGLDATEPPEFWDPGGRYLQNWNRAKVVRLDESGSTVEVAFPCTTPLRKTGDCVVVFDLSKGGLLTEMKMKEFDTGNDPPTEKRRYGMQATEPVNVDGVWLPTKFEMTAWSRNYPKQITLYEATVNDIELGKLRPGDLKVEFPPDTEVRDLIAGKRYRVAQDGSQVESAFSSKPD